MQHDIRPCLQFGGQRRGPVRGAVRPWRAAVDELGRQLRPRGGYIWIRNRLIDRPVLPCRDIARMRDDPTAACGERKPAVAVIAGDDARIVRAWRQQALDGRAVARIERERVYAERPFRVERRKRFRAGEHELRVRMLPAQLRDQCSQEQRVAEKHVMDDQNARRLRGLASQRLEDELGQRARKDLDPAVKSAHGGEVAPFVWTVGRGLDF